MALEVTFPEVGGAIVDPGGGGRVRLSIGVETAIETVAEGAARLAAVTAAVFSAEVVEGGADVGPADDVRLMGNIGE